MEGKAGTVVRQGCELRKKESEYAKEYSAQNDHYRKTYQMLPPSELIMIRHHVQPPVFSPPFKLVSGDAFSAPSAVLPKVQEVDNSEQNVV